MVFLPAREVLPFYYYIYTTNTRGPRRDVAGSGSSEMRDGESAPTPARGHPPWLT